MSVTKAIRHLIPVGPLDERNFRRLFLARTLSYLGDGIAPVALAFGVLAIDPTPIGLASVLAVRYLSLAVSLLLAGVIGDRLPRRRVLIAADLLRFVVQSASAILLISGRAEVWMLAALAALYGLGEACFRPTSTGFVRDVISPARVQQANALISTASSAAVVIGPAVAGVVVTVAGPGQAIAIDAATFLLSACFVATIRGAVATQREARSFIGDLVDGWRVFRSTTWLWLDGLYAALGNALVMAPLLAIGPALALRSHDGPLAWSAILTALGIGSGLGGVVLLRFRPRRPLAVGIAALTLLAAPTGLLAVEAPLWMVVAGALAGGAGLATYTILFETTVQRFVPPQMLSRVVSINGFASIALTPIGYAIAGYAAQVAGLGVPLAAAAVWIVVSSAVVVSAPAIRQVTLARPSVPPA